MDVMSVSCVKQETLCPGKPNPREGLGVGSPLHTHPHVDAQTCQQLPGAVGKRVMLTSLSLKNTCYMPPILRPHLEVGTVGGA